jgi:hypothetical protein
MRNAPGHVLPTPCRELHHLVLAASLVHASRPSCSMKTETPQHRVIAWQCIGDKPNRPSHGRRLSFACRPMRPEWKKHPVRATPGAAGAIVGLLDTTAQAAYMLVLKAE